MNKTEINGSPSVPRPRGCAGSQLGKLHKWWLRKFKKSTGLLVDYGYAETPYASALIGLMNRGLIKFVAGFDGCGFVELTKAGVEVKNFMANGPHHRRRKEGASNEQE